MHAFRFALPPPSPKEDTSRFSGGLVDTEKTTSDHPPSLEQGNTLLGKRKRAVSPELCSPQSSPETVSSNGDVIDLTQD